MRGINVNYCKSLRFVRKAREGTTRNLRQVVMAGERYEAEDMQ